MWLGNLIFSSAYILVMVGGAIGSLLRFMMINRLAILSGSSGFPIGTVVVNILGSFLMGIIIGAMPRNSSGFISGPIYWLLGVGVLGGFTTFSTFSLDVLTLFYSANKVASLVYLLVSVFGSIAACFLGFWLVRSIFS